jgi:hypothetical protein
MTKEWPQENLRTTIVRISDPAMEWHEIDLNDLLGCAKRELAFRQRCYPKWVERGTLTEKKAEKELELMRSLVEFLVHCVFKAVTRNQGAKL